MTRKGQYRPSVKRISCPLCTRNVAVYEDGTMSKHSTPSVPGTGFHGISRPCRGSERNPEEMGPK